MDKNKEAIIKEEFKDCHGCDVKTSCYENYLYGAYDIYYKNGVQNCPCKTCLVKMLCGEICEEYDKVWEKQGHWKDKERTTNSETV